MFEHWLNSNDPQPQSSFGNGAAMRVSALGWLYDDWRQVKQEAARSAMPSHCHKEGIKGAQCVALLIYWLRTVRVHKDEVVDLAHKAFGYETPSLRDIYRIGRLGHVDSTCQETVPAAIRCFEESQNFEDAIRTAVLADGDTDTKAAICGSIAEAYYEIPEELAAKAYEFLPVDMLRVVEQFCALAQADAGRK